MPRERKIRVAACAYKQVRLEEMADLAMRIAGTGADDLEMVLFLYEHLDPSPALMERLRASGVRLLQADTGDSSYRKADLTGEHYGLRGGGGERGLRARADALLDRVVRGLLRRFPRSSLGRWYRERHYLNRLRDNYRNLLPLFRRYDPDVMMTTGDRHRTLEPVMLRIARETGARILVPYVAFYAEPEELVTKYRENPPNPGGPVFPLYDRLAERRLRHTSREGAWFYPHWQARALQKFGTLSPNPWVMGAGMADVLCLPNRKMADDYREYEIDPAKLRVVGDVSYERLHRSWQRRETVRRELAGNYGLDPGGKIVILALPPLAEHGDMNWERHWKEIDLLVRSACQLGANTLLSLHPKMDSGSYGYLENNQDCRLLDERLVDVLPAADFFMASFSSTVLWAVLCGIKSAVLDFYGFRYDYYDAYDSVDVISSREELGPRLRKSFGREVDFSGDWERVSREKVFFGNTVRNYVSLIRELA